jgi:hypothetical protein
MSIAVPRRGLVLVVALVAVAALVLLWQGLWVRPGAALAQAGQQLATMSGTHATTSLAIQLPEHLRGRLRPFRQVKVVLEGDVARSEKGLQMAGTLKGEARGPGNTFFTNGDIRVLDDAVAFRLEDFPVLLNPTGSLVNKWTYVATPALELRTTETLREAWDIVVSAAAYDGRETFAGEQVLRFRGTLVPEEKQRLVELLQLETTGNQGLHVLARLLAANDVESFSLAVSARGRQLRQITAHFVRPLEDGSVYDFATWELSLNDAEEAVVIERPPQELTAQPSVFAKLFGSGDIEAIR